MKNRTIDDTGHEIRTKHAGRLVCKCGLSVALTMQTDVWTEVKDHRYLPMKWRHAEYGTPTGMCDCGWAYCGMPDGAMVRIDCRHALPAKQVVEAQK